MAAFVYLFEAGSIQNYLLSGGKLADMVAASELVEQLTSDILDTFLRALNLKEGENIYFSRRAGGAFFAALDSAEQAKRLQNLISISLPHIAPGLQFIHCCAEGETDYDAFQKGIETLGQLRNFPQPKPPIATSMAMRAPRTGGVAMENSRLAGGQEWSDAALVARREFDKTRFAKGKLAQRFAGKDSGIKASQWPKNLQDDGGDSAFPFNEGNDRLAILHVDGNGLGQILIALNQSAKQMKDKYIEVYRGFSDALGNATESAAQKATTDVVLKDNSVSAKESRMLPARPLVLGGDDLSIT